MQHLNCSTAASHFVQGNCKAIQQVTFDINESWMRTNDLFGCCPIVTHRVTHHHCHLLACYLACLLARLSTCMPACLPACQSPTMYAKLMCWLHCMIYPVQNIEPSNFKPSLDPQISCIRCLRTGPAHMDSVLQPHVPFKVQPTEEMHNSISINSAADYADSVLYIYTIIHVM